MKFSFVCREIPAAVFFTIVATPAAFAANATWNVGITGPWATAGNWTPAAAPGAILTTGNTDVAIFGPSLGADRTVTVDADRNIGGITFSNTSNFKYTLSGGNLLLSSSGVIDTTGSGTHIDTISTPITIQEVEGSATFRANATSTTSVMNIGAVSGVSSTSSVTTLYLDGTNTGANTISGIISDGSALGKLAIVKNQTGSWTLSGANTYSGGTTIYEGTVTPTVVGALGTGLVNVDGSSAILSLGAANVTAGAVYLTNGQITSTTGTLTGSSFNLQSGTISAKLAGTTAALTKSNFSTVILTGANSYGGNTNANDGILQFKTPGSLPGQTTAGKIKIAAFGTLALNVGGAGEFTTTDVANVLTNATFTAGGFLGLDTTTTPSTFNYATTIAGAKGIAKLGTGTLTLSGAAANTHTGGTKVLAGTLAAGKINALGGATCKLTVDGSSAILNLSTFNQTVGAVSLGANGGTISGTTGILTGSTYNLENGTVSAKLAGGATSKLSKILTGTVTLSGLNTYAGGNTVSGGTLRPTVAGALGSTANSLTVTGNTSVLELGAVNQTVGAVSLKLDGSITSTTGILTGSGFTVESGTITAKLAGTVAGSGLIKNNTTGTVVLSGTNTYGGTTAVKFGTLRAKIPGSLPNYATAGKVTVDSGATLIVDGGGAGFTEANITSLLGAATFTSGALFGIDTTAPASFNYTAALPNKAITFVKSGTGTLNLTSGTNAYTGGTQVLGGTLALGTTGKLGTGALTVNGGTLALGTVNQTVTTVSLLNAGSITGTTGILTGTAYNLQDGAISAILAGTTAKLTKTNSLGTVTLSGANTFSGGVLLTAGTLVLNSAGALGTSGAITFGNTTGVLQFSANNTTDYSARFATTASQNFRFNVPANLSVTLASGLISTSGKLTKEGAGTLVLSSTNANTYNAGTNLWEGTLRVPKAAALPGKTTFGLIEVSNYIGTTNLWINAGGTGEFIDTDFTALMTNADFISGPTLSIDTSSGNFTCTSDLNAPVKLAKLGSNTLTLSGANDYYFGTDIGLVNQPNAGTLLMSGSGTLGDQFDPGPLVIYGGTLDLGGTTQAIDSLTLGLGATGSTSTILIGSGELQLGSSGYVSYNQLLNPSVPNGATISSDPSGKLSLMYDTLFDVYDSTAAVNDLTISANIVDGDATARSMTKSGSGTLLLSGNNTYSGSTTVDEGTVWITKGTALPVPAGSGTILMRRGTLLNVKVGGTDEFSPTQLAAVLAKTDFTGDTIIGNASLGIDTTNASGGSFTYAANLADTTPGPPDHILDLRKLGPGTLVLSGTNNTYSGKTSILGGTLQVTGTLQGGGLVTVPSGSTLLVSPGGTIKRSVSVSGGLFNLDGSMTGATATVSGGTLNLAGTIGTGGALSLLGGTVNTVGAAATINSLTLPTKAVTPVFKALSGEELIITSNLTQPYTGGMNSITAGTPAFKVSGANLVNNIDKLILRGGTTKIEGFVGNFQPGLDVRGWQGTSGTPIDGARFELTSPSPAPHHSSILPSTSLGYATGSIHTESGDWFTNTGSGVLTGAKPTGYNENFALEYRGKLRITTPGNYTFATRSDDGSALWINPGVENPPYSTAAVKNNFSQGMTTRNSSPINLGAGDHDIIIRFNQGTGGRGMFVQWDPSGGTSFADIPGSNFYHGSQAPGDSNLETTDVVPTANSILDLGNASFKTTLGNLTLTGQTLTIQNGALASFNSITATENSTIGGTVPIALRNGAVTVDAGKTLTVNSGIANGATASSLNKLGLGSLILNGATTYTGTTTLSAGTLTLGNANALQGSNLVFNGGILNAGGIPTMTLGGLTANVDTTFPSSISNIIVGYPTWSAAATKTLSIGGAITRMPGAAINLTTTALTGTVNGAPLGVLLGTNTVNPWATFASADWAVYDGSKIAVYSAYTPLGGTLTAATIPSAPTANYRINNTNPTSGNVTLATTGTIDINSLVVNGPTARTVDVRSGATQGILRIGTNGGILLAGGLHTIGVAGVGAPGTLTAGGATPNTAGDLPVMANASGTINSVIADNGTGKVSFSKYGTGVLTLSGVNTYTGDTRINFGAVTLSNALAIPNGAGKGSVWIESAGTLNMAATKTINGLNGAGTVNSTANMTLTLGDAGASGSFSGVLKNTTGTLGLTKTGAGTQILSGTNTYSGVTTISGGTLQLGSGGTAGALSTIAGSTISIGTGAAFSVNQTDTVKQGVDFSGVAISGAGGLSQLGTGTTALTVANTYTGPTTVNGGELSLDFSVSNPANILAASSALNLGGGTLTIKGKATGGTAQTLGAVTLNAGNGRILGNVNGGSSTGLTLGALTTNVVGGSLLVGTAGANMTGLTITTTTNKTFNIYGGRAVFFNGTANTGYDWMTTNSGATPFILTGLTSYTTMTAPALTDTSNVQMTGALSLSGVHVRNSLKINSGSTLAIGAHSVTLTSGGLLSTGTVASTISGNLDASRLMGGNGTGVYDLIVHQFNSGGLNISAVIGNGASATALTKAGSGPLTLSGENTYTGATSVNSGRLLIDAAGSIANTSAITVRGGEFSYNSATPLTKAVTFADPSATLSGNGTLGTAATTIQGIHAPGNPLANSGVGTQTSTAGLTYGASSRLQWQLIANAVVTRGVQFDAVDVTAGALAITPGATLDLVFSGAVNFTNSFWDTNRTWTVVDVTGTATASDTNVFNLGSITGGSYSPNEGFFTITRFDGDVILNWIAAAAAVVPSAYDQWATNKGLTGAPGSSTDPAVTADPDKDGTTNLVEFAFNGNPTNGASTGQIHGLTADSSDGGTNKEMILTVAVRKTAPVFTTAAPSVSTVDGITYRIEGGSSLSAWATTVTPVTPLTSGLPAVTDPTNYEYRSFSLSGSDGLPGKGFLRAKVTQP